MRSAGVDPVAGTLRFEHARDGVQNIVCTSFKSEVVKFSTNYRRRLSPLQRETDVKVRLPSGFLRILA